MTEGSHRDLLSGLIVQASEQLRSQGREPSMAFEATQLLGQLGVAAAPRLAGTGDPEPDRTVIDPIRFGRYVVTGELGRGSAGDVYEAYDPELRRAVAVKVLRDHHTEPEILERFVAEAQVTAQLEHPGVVPVHDLGITAEGRLFFVMKRVRGRSLFQILGGIARREPDVAPVWTRHRRLTSFVQICRAVAYAHDRGVVHRDLKPSNLMFGEFGEALVMDWGISRVVRSGGPAPVERLVAYETAAGQAVGTVGYMSPEQTLGAHDELGPASDVWSLGVILYETLAIRRAFKGSFEQVATKVRSGPLRVDPSSSMVPDAIRRVVERATQVHPANRYPDASALADAVDEYIAEIVDGAPSRR